MNPDELPILGGIPVNRRQQKLCKIARYIPPLGAEKVPCDNCRQPLWIGPAQMKIKEAHPDALILCPKCAGPFMRGAEIRAAGGRGGEFLMEDGTHYSPGTNG